MLKLTIGIVGKISSGKSSITKALKKATGIPEASFGSFLVDYSKKHQLPTDRHSLQELGSQFIEQSPEAFLAAMLEQANLASDTIIIEGIRHLSVLNAVKSISETVFTIYIDATSETRYKRHCERSKQSDALEIYSDFQLKNQHPVEAQIDLLKSQSDLIIDSENLSIDETVKQISFSLKSFAPLLSALR